MPATDTPVPTLAAPDYRSQLVDLLDSAENAAALTQDRLATGALRALEDATAIGRGVRAKLSGGVGTDLDDVNDLAKKLTGKSLKQARRYLSDAYNYAFTTGMIYPTIEQVVAGLQTGDYFGSMQLPGTAERGAPTPIGANGKPPSGPVPTGTPVIPPTFPPGPGPILPPPGPGPGPQPPPPPQPPQPPPPPPPPGPQGPRCDELYQWDPAQPLIPPNVPRCCPLPGGSQFELLNCGYGCVVGRGNWASSPFEIFQPHGTTDYARPIAFDPGPFEGFTFHQCCGGQADAQYAGVVVPNYDFCWWIPDGYTVMSFGDGNLWGVRPGAQHPPAVECPVFCGTTSGGDDGIIPPTPQPQPPTCPVDPCAPKPEPVCPQPIDKPCGPEKPKWAGQLNKDNDFDCSKWEDLVHQAGKLDFDLSHVINMVSAGIAVTPIISDIAKIVTGGAGAILPALAVRLQKWLSEQIKQATTLGGCNVVELTPIALAMGALNFLNKYTGVVPDAAVETLRQAAHWVCQYKLPTGDDADRAYLADAIDRKVWECWHHAEGNQTRSFEQVMQAQRTKPNVRDALHALWRKKIDQKTYENYVRAAGVIREDERRVFEWVESAWPSLSDVVRYMVRDVADKDAIERGHLDEDFEKKFTGKLKEFAEGLGVDEELMKYAWRAHWQRVGNTQLFDMLHRNRPGQVPADQVMTVPKVREWLKQNDVAPGLVDQLISISYSVVTRVDARRMYRQHTIDEKRLNELYQDRGYNETNAAELVQWEQVERRIAEAKASGIPTLKTMVNRFANGEATSNELVQVAQLLTTTPEQVEQVQQAAELARDMRQRQQIIAGLKKRYVRCLLSDSQAAVGLGGAGVEADEISSLIRQWSAARECRGKEVSADYLCKLRKSRIIGEFEQRQALARAQWSVHSIDLMVAECNYEIEQALLKEDERRRKAEERAREKAERDAKKCKPKPCPPGREPTPAEPATPRNGKAGR